VHEACQTPRGKKRKALKPLSRTAFELTSTDLLIRDAGAGARDHFARRKMRLDE
jgi:hypothetical protein